MAEQWEWSLDAVIGVAGIGVGALGAIATTLVAVLALVQTRRANMLAAATVTREEKDALYRAVETYLAGWKGGPVTGWQSQAAGMSSSSSLLGAAATISPEAVEVVTWLFRALHDANLAALQHRDGPPDKGFVEHPPWELTALLIRHEAGRRVIEWARTGVLERAPLVEY